MQLQKLYTLSVVLCWFLLQGCAHGETANVVLSMQKLSCASCGGKAVKALQKNPHVKEAKFDYANAELSVDYNPEKTTPETLQKQASTAGYKIVLGAGQGNYLPPERYDEGLDVSWLALEGQAIEVKEHLAVGKITVVDFYAPWCGPCRILDKHLNKILQTQSDVAVRKLNIVTWETPLAKKYGQYMSKLPHVFVFDAKGNQVASISGLEPEKVQAAIDKARQEATTP
ncbi:MAG: thiol reductase thioredoxin [Myxococcales bacterium]|nr:thiol reductase thioredoxin [Myxococcales bacterium]|tara:strand:- start:326 stop:1009 length:684 start_codon:yes stop_codon:yes gene_type:complete